MESSIPNTSTSSSKSVELSYEMDSSNEEIDQQVLREAGEQTINAEWSATVSALNSSDTTSSNSYINIETLKECCANPSDTLKDKEDFMVFESSSTVVNISKFNDTKYYSECKTTAFQKKHKPLSQNVSRCFENILNDDSQMEITQSSICLNRFQKRKRMIPPNDEEFIEINNSNYSGSNSVEVSMTKSPKFRFSREKKDQFEISDFNLSATDSDSIANETNISKRKENASNRSLVVNDSSNNMKNISRTEVFTNKFSLKTIGVADSVFENIINNSSIVSDITLNNKKTSLNETALSNVNNTSVFSKMDLSNLNHTYDIPNNTNSTSVKASIAGDADNIPIVKQNTVFKKPSNLSILVNDSSNNIMDVSKTEVLPQKFNKKSIGVTDSAFDNIIDDSSMTSNIRLNNMKTSLNETSVSNINNSKMDMSHLNYTYDIPTNINTSKIDVIIPGEANIPKVKQNTDLKKPLNSSIVVNDSYNNIIDVSKTEVLTQKFNKKSIGVTDSAFDNIIDDSSMTSNIRLNNMKTSLNETSVSNINNSKMDMSHLNYTYDIPTNINTSKIDVIIPGEANIPKVKQNTDLKKPSNSSIVVNDSSNNIMDVSKPEIFTHKFNRKTIDVNHSVFNNIINDSSITSDITLNNKRVSLIETSVSNDNTPVFSTTDVSNSNHTYDIPMNNNTTLLDAIVEHDKNMSETHDSLQNNRSKSFNLRPLKFNFSNKFGRHSLSLQENKTSFDGVKQHNISLNTDFCKNSGEESNTFHKSANNSNVNLKSHTHFSIIQDVPPIDDPLLTNTLKQEQLKSKSSISSNSNNKDFSLSNTTTKSLESNELLKNQSKHSMSSTSSNDGLTLLNSTTGLLGSCSSSRTQSRLLTSKKSKSSTSNNDTLNSNTESLNSNESQNDLSKHLISSTSNNKDLTFTNSTTGFSGRRSSSRNKSTASEYSTSVISNHDSLTSLNATTEMSVGGRLSRNQSKHSTSVISDNDNLTLFNTTMESLKSNETQKTQSKRSGLDSYNEGLTLTNSTTEYLGRRSSSRNKSTSSEHSKSVTSNHDSLTSLNATTETSIGGRSLRNRSIHSTSVVSNNDSLTLLNTSMESLKSNESQKTQSKRSISPISYNESLKSTNSTTGSSGRRSSSRNKSSSTPSNHSTSVISNNDNLSLLNTSMESLKSNESQKTHSNRSISPTSYNESLKSTNSTTGSSGRCSSSRNKSSSTPSNHSTSVISNNDSKEISVGGRSSKNQSKHSTSVISNNDNLTLLNTSMESLKNNESQKTQSKRSISPTSYDESLKLTHSTTGSSRIRSSSRNKSSLLKSKHSTSVISHSDSLTSLNDSKEISVGGRSSRNQSKHSKSVISNPDILPLLNAVTMESLKSNESQKTKSERSISPVSYNESLKSTNSTTGSSGRRSSSRNKSSLLKSKHSTSVISNNDSLTSLNNSKEISVGGRSLSNQSKHSKSVISNNDNLNLVNTTMESLKSNESPKTQSKRSISPTSYNESLKSTHSTTGSSGRRSSSRNKSSLLKSKHSTSVISNNDSLTSLNNSKEISVGGRSLSNQSKHSKSVISNNDNLNLVNTTMESLKSNESPKTQSKRSISPTSYNESLKSTHSTTGSSRIRSSSRNKSSLLTSKHSTTVISNSDSLTSLNNSKEISVGGRSLSNQSKHSTSVISNHNSLLLLNAATMGSSEINESPKTQSTTPTLNNDNLTTLNTTTESLKQNVFSMNVSIPKHSSLINSGKTSINTLKLEDVINNVSRMSTRSSKRKSNCSGNVEPITSTIIDGLSNSGGSTIKNNTTGVLEQKISSINQLNSSPNISKKTSTNGLILEDDANNISKMYASSSKEKNNSYDDIEQIMPNITDGSLVENRPSKTRVLRSSPHINKNKSLPTKSLTSKNDINNLSIGSTRTSKNITNFSNETFDNNSDNSLFWTTLPDESTNISSIQNVNMNTFQTPKRNKLSIAENIANTIKIMSTNKRKSTHPGAFELDDHNDGPLTRSLVTRSCDRSPSILTVVFGKQKVLESTSSLTQSPSEVIIDQSQVEENVKQKFKSLYKKEYWITKRLYKFLIIKLQPNYNIYSVKYAEKFVKYLAQLFKQILKDQVNLQLYSDMLRYHMARYHIIKDTFDYLGFLCDYIPMEYYKKLAPGWNLETSAVKFDPQKCYIPLMDDEEFLNYIMEHLNEA